MLDVLILKTMIKMPPVTRIIFFLSIIVAAGIYLEYFNVFHLMFSPKMIIHGQVHRLICSFFYFGNMNPEICLQLLFLYRYSSMLEESMYSTSDYAYLVFIVMFLIISLSVTTTYIRNIDVLGPSLYTSLTYIWTRKNPRAVVQLMGFINLYAFYLPFFIPFVSILFDGRFSWEEIIGIIAGHIYYYFKEVLPRFGPSLFDTPCFLHKLFREPCKHCRKEAIKENVENRIDANDIFQRDQVNMPETSREDDSEKNERCSSLEKEDDMSYIVSEDFVGTEKLFYKELNGTDLKVDIPNTKSMVDLENKIKIIEANEKNLSGKGTPDEEFENVWVSETNSSSTFYEEDDNSNGVNNDTSTDDKKNTIFSVGTNNDDVIDSEKWSHEVSNARMDQNKDSKETCTEERETLSDEMENCEWDSSQI